MSLNTAMLTAVSGLQAAQQQMQITSGNVANANVEGYSRKSADPQTLVVGTDNAGVRLSTVTRDVNTFLKQEVRQQDTALSNMRTLSEFHSRIQELFGTLGNDSTLASSLNDLQGSLEALASEPESAAARNDVIEAAQELSQQFNRFTSETQALRGEADNQIDLTVNEINDKLQEIRDLNIKISSAIATDEPIGELEDQRDRALATLSESLELQTFERATGEMVVMTNEGGLLVDRTANLLSFNPTGNFQPSTPGNSVTLPSTGNTLTASAGGRLGALIQVRDSALPDFQADIDRLASQIRDQVNEVHNQGTFGNAPSASVAGARNFVDGMGNVADGIAGVSGSFQLVETDAAGNVVNNITVDLDAAPPIADVNDLVTEINNQIGAQGGSATASFAGNQFTLSAGGTAGVALDTGDARIDGDLGDRNFSHYFGMNDFFQTPNVPKDPVAAASSITGAAQTMQVRTDIVADQDLLARGRVHTTAGSEAIPGGDATVTQALGGVFETTFQFADPGVGPGNLDGRATTLSGYAGDVLQFQAAETARLERNTEFQSALRDELQFRAESESGVNIDEEMSNLLNFEQAYNASARIISTVQEMFDTLAAMAR